MKFRHAFVFAAAVAVAAAAGAAVADPAEDAVLARQGFFKLLGAEIGPLAAMAKGEAPYDAGKAAAHGADLAALAGYALPQLFIDGTSQDDLKGKTWAKPDIWLDKADFTAKFTALQTAVSANAGKLGGGRAELGAALGAIGATCKACHDAYRAD
jgi:cytochrome c556